MKKIIFLFFIFSSFLSFSISKEVESIITISKVFNINADLEGGVKGTVNTEGKIEIRVFDKLTNTLLYQVILRNTSLTDFLGEGRLYNKGDLGGGAIYYPNQWFSKDIKTSLLGIDRRRVNISTERPYLFFQKDLNVVIQIIQENAQLNSFKIPGIGVIDDLGGNPLFDSNHYCHDLRHINDFVTIAWTKMKKPNLNKGADLSIAAHRGFWGDDLGRGDPENSVGAFYATKNYTDVLETDIMITKDGKLIISHDYSLSRLSNYPGPLSDYLFDMNSSQLTNLKLRRRNGEVSNFQYLFFEDVVDILVDKKMIMTVDIKDIRARHVDGICVANCSYSPKLHGDIALKKIKDSWMTCLKECIRIANEKKSLQYLAFKTPFTYEELKEYVPDSLLTKVLFMPVIQPNRKDFLSFTDKWILEGGNKVIAYETNFLNEKDKYLKPIEKEDETYLNLLHYIYEKTGLRSGCYPEEPIGQMGTVTRWVEWKMKYTNSDRRGDHYWLMTIPYGKIMVLTTDRPDIWKTIENIYNGISSLNFQTVIMQKKEVTKNGKK